MNCRTAVKLLALLAVAVMVLSTNARAVDPRNVFELEGNVADDPNISLDDWNTLNGDCSQPGGGSGSAGGSVTRTCISSEDPPKIFTGGGSKDPLDISSWRWKAADTVPDKDTITTAYAASYNNTNTGGDKVLVMGADRFAVNGDANIGVWFFQNQIGTNSNGTFSGVHKNKDVFLVSAFVGGGGTSVITAYEWDSTCTKAVKSPTNGQCAETNLRLLGSSDTFAITNSQPLSNATWPYLAKFGSNSTTMPVGAFFEGGADLTALFSGVGAGAVPCFSSFMAETRSSQTPSAVLKDFVLGSFPECKVGVTKSCQCTAFHADGSGFDYRASGTVFNDGGGTVYNVTVTDSQSGNSYACGTLAPKGQTGDSKNWPADCTPTATYDTFSNASYPITNQASVSAKTAPSGGTTITAQTDAVSCAAEATTGACTPAPQLTVDKQCVTTLVSNGSNVVVRVDYTGQVHNGGNVNITGVVVHEDNTGDGTDDTTFTVGALSKAGTAGADKCYTYSSSDAAQPTCPALAAVPSYNSSTPTHAASYFPVTGTGANPGRVQFSDTVRATGTDAFGGSVQSHAAGSGYTANCTVCPYGACPTSAP